MPLVLKNPHSVLAVLETRPQDVLQVTVPPKASNEFWEKVARQAKDLRIPVVSSGQKGAPQKGGPQKGPRPVVRGAPQEESTRMGSAEASVRERSPLSSEEIFKGARDRAGGTGLWLALDCLQDPHNVGAVFRAAAFFGVQGIIMTQERSAPLTSTVYDVASGGVEYIPFAAQTNLQQGFEIAKEAGLWILGTSEHAHDDIKTVSRDRPWLLVLGNEEKGMRRLTEETCDVLCKVSGVGKVTSLNVSVAAGILISRLTGK
ncbi:MAG: 23S rRNA (guanosine(2251)-2'-O)-methyltransferase RlmB [Bdellovibrionia bacterium]